MFQLSVELTGHEQDVRSVVEHREWVVSSSRDRSVRLWESSSGTLYKTFYGHEHYVGCVYSLKQSPYFPCPALLSGGNDKKILQWDIDTGEYQLIGEHEDAVVCMSSTATGELISGSWDKSVKLWQGSKCVATLKAHSHSVWAVLGMPTGDILSASADKSIIVWRNNAVQLKLTNHEDAVRGLALVPSIGFLSASNDTIIILWSNNYEPLQMLHGHENFIYSVGVLPTGEFISSSEDKTLRVWKDGTCSQVIKHPGTVWACCPLQNGEVVTACSDSAARIWSRFRSADPQQIKNYEGLVETSHTLPTGQSVGSVQLHRLPGLDALEIPGKKDGETKLVRNGNVGEAYQWSAANGSWTKIGDVVTGADESNANNTGNVFNGKTYDHVFDVDVGDGTLRRLPYNNFENPYTVAQEFLWREGMDQGWLDQVAQFIIQNTKQFTIGSEDTAPSSNYSDPFTGSGRYVPNAPVPTKASSAPTKKFTHFPVSVMLKFDTGNFSQILGKLLEFNETLKKEAPATAYSAPEEEAVKQLAYVLSETSRYHVSSITGAQIQCLIKALRWNDKYRFPALDLFRLVVFHPEGRKRVQELGNQFVELLLENGCSSSVPTNNILGFRFIANLLSFESTQTMLAAVHDKLLEKLADASQVDNKQLKIVLATVILNLAVLYLNNSSKFAQQKMQCISILAELLSLCNDQDSEAVYRAFVAVGTLVHNDTATLKLLDDFEIVKFFNQANLQSMPKITEVATEFKSLLNSN